MDNLLRPQHPKTPFFMITPLSSFDVMKAPMIEADLTRFEAHLKKISK